MIDRIKFTELTRRTTERRTAEDLTRLVEDARKTTVPPLTVNILRSMLEMGTRIFVAIDGEWTIGVILLVPVPGLTGQEDVIKDLIISNQYPDSIGERLKEMAINASKAGPALKLVVQIR